MSKSTAHLSTGPLISVFTETLPNGEECLTHEEQEMPTGNRIVSAPLKNDLVMAPPEKEKKRDIQSKVSSEEHTPSPAPSAMEHNGVKNTKLHITWV